MILSLTLYLLVLVFSFYVLMKSSDYLISSSSIIGKRLGISKFVIGLTIVAIGTSLPELFTSIIAIFSTDNFAPFIFGTVIGSNISNILLVLAVYVLFSKKHQKNAKIFDIIFLLLSTIIIAYLAFIETVSIAEGILLIIIFGLYIFYSIKGGKKKDILNEADEINEDGFDKKSNFIISLILLTSLVGLNISARGVVFSIENLGLLLNIPIEILTLTTVAFATSLPEIVVTYSSSKRGEGDIAIGNIIGSNISNIFLIIGVSSILKTINIDFSNYLISLIFLIIATIAFISILYKKKIQKYHGVMLLLIYGIYLYMIIF